MVPARAYQTLLDPLSCIIKIRKQSGVDDCGLFAIANAASICCGQDSAVMTFDQSFMRLHLAQLARK